MAFFRLTLSNRNRGASIVVLLESPAHNLNALGTVLNNPSDWVVGTEWRQFRRGEWRSNPCAVAVSQIAKVNQVAAPRIEPDEYGDDDAADALEAAQ